MDDVADEARPGGQKTNSKYFYVFLCSMLAILVKQKSTRQVSQKHDLSHIPLRFTTISY